MSELVGQEMNVSVSVPDTDGMQRREMDCEESILQLGSYLPLLHRCILRTHLEIDLITGNRPRLHPFNRYKLDGLP